MKKKGIPIIDLFAGPGGLGEGFASLEDENGNPRFKIALSVEMDEHAHQTLELRAFYRQFPKGAVPIEYYKHLRGELSRSELFNAHSAAGKSASLEAWKATLGKNPHWEVKDRIKKALGKSDQFVLIGGPPCQAYSLAGRSRNKGNSDYVPDKDHRQYLYLQYLQIIADHAPAVFIMENVKGILSAKVANQHMFERIKEDLANPAVALSREGMPISRSSRRYNIYALNAESLPSIESAEDFVVRCENYSIPQARHRVIIVGVRTDLNPNSAISLAVGKQPISVRQVLESIPPLRSGLSKQEDNPKTWRSVLRMASNAPWYKSVKTSNRSVYDHMEKILDHIGGNELTRGAEFYSTQVGTSFHGKWYLDSKIGGICNHVSRGHMDSDLHRYLFASCFAEIMGKSPALADFPNGLLPAHRNVRKGLKGNMFADRFRVQVWDRPATTVVSHISKDGHYYIHPDPAQCRSITVREAARLQTFPDNYMFCGNRTQQYHQVGNAVPPLLAHQIAKIVSKLFE